MYEDKYPYAALGDCLDDAAHALRAALDQIVRIRHPEEDNPLGELAQNLEEAIRDITDGMLVDVREAIKADRERFDEDSDRAEAGGL